MNALLEDLCAVAILAGVGYFVGGYWLGFAFGAGGMAAVAIALINARADRQQEECDGHAQQRLDDDDRISASVRTSVGVGLLAQAFGTTGSYIIAFGTQAQMQPGRSGRLAVRQEGGQAICDGHAQQRLDDDGSPVDLGDWPFGKKEDKQ